MPEAQINTDLMKKSAKVLSDAMTAKAHELKILPMDCEYTCNIEVGADGKPRVVCGITCSG